MFAKRKILFTHNPNSFEFISNTFDNNLLDKIVNFCHRIASALPTDSSILVSMHDIAAMSNCVDEMEGEVGDVNLCGCFLHFSVNIYSGKP